MGVDTIRPWPKKLKSQNHFYRERRIVRFSHTRQHTMPPYEDMAGSESTYTPCPSGSSRASILATRPHVLDIF